jgi:hypothetical protein
MTTGRGDSGDWTIALSSPTLPMNRNLPSLSDGGQGRGREPLPGRAVGLYFQAHVLGAANHVRDADGVFAQPVAQLLRVGADAVEPQQHDQGSKPCIHRPEVWIFSVHHLPKSPMDPAPGRPRYRLALLSQKVAGDVI